MRGVSGVQVYEQYVLRPLEALAGMTRQLAQDVSKLGSGSQSCALDKIYSYMLYNYSK